MCISQHKRPTESLKQSNKKWGHKGRYEVSDRSAALQRWSSQCNAQHSVWPQQTQTHRLTNAYRQDAQRICSEVSSSRAELSLRKTMCESLDPSSLPRSLCVPVIWLSVFLSRCLTSGGLLEVYREVIICCVSSALTFNRIGCHRMCHYLIFSSNKLRQEAGQ